MNQYLDLSPKELIKQLLEISKIWNEASRGKQRPAEYADLVHAIRARREEIEPLLLKEFREAVFIKSYDAEYHFVLQHIWRVGEFLLAWKNPGAIAPFAHIYKYTNITEEYTPIVSSRYGPGIEPATHAFEEIPDRLAGDIFHLGPDIFPYFHEILNINQDIIGEGAYHYGRLCTITILTRLAIFYPSTRQKVIDAFQAQLPPIERIDEVVEAIKAKRVNKTSDPCDYNLMFWAEIAAELGHLGDTSSVDHITRLYEAGLLADEDESFDWDCYQLGIAAGFDPLIPLNPDDIRVEYHFVSWHDRYLYGTTLFDIEYREDGSRFYTGVEFVLDENNKLHPLFAQSLMGY